MEKVRKVRKVRRVREVRRVQGVLPREDGIALLVALMAMLLLTALGAALVLATSSETIIAANFRRSAELLYAADAGLERVIDDLPAGPGLELGSARPRGFVVCRRPSVRAAHAGRRLDDRFAPNCEPRQLREDEFVHRRGNERRDGGSALGGRQPPMGADRVWASRRSADRWGCQFNGISRRSGRGWRSDRGHRRQKRWPSGPRLSAREGGTGSSKVR